MVRKIFGLGVLALFALSIAACSGKANCDCDTNRGGDIELICSEVTENLPDGCLSLAANINLKLVKNGTFVMGSNSTDTLIYSLINVANPKHNVTISKPFYLGIYEVTQDQWESVNGSNPSANVDWRDEISAGTANMSNHPVNYIGYLDALGFIEALNDAEPNITINGEQYVYSLPTEAEFEYVLRASTTSERYFCADNASQADCNQSAQNYEWLLDNTATAYHLNGRHQEVGTRAPNPWGFYDMNGNLGEIVLDMGSVFSACTYLSSDITDPICNDASYSILYRSGRYSESLSFMYSAGGRDNMFNVMDKDSDIGFRVALVAKSVRDNMTKFANGAIIP